MGNPHNTEQFPVILLWCYHCDGVNTFKMPGNQALILSYFPTIYIVVG